MVAGLRYLFDPRGRIGRLGMWLFLLCAIVWLVGVKVAAGYVFPSSHLADVAEHHGGYATALSTMWSPNGTLRSTGFVMVQLAFLWAWIAVMAKRLHDRNKSAVWLLLFWLLPLILGVIAFVSFIKLSSNNMSFGSPLMLGVLVLQIVAFGLMLWGGVELYCLRGNSGENRFGRDPRMQQ